jgi:hypothetical protein
LKRGGQVIYAGDLGRHSHKLVEYFEVSYFAYMFRFAGGQDFTYSELNTCLQNMITGLSKSIKDQTCLELLAGVAKVKKKRTNRWV